MVIATDNNLIPYPGHQYQVQPYIQDNRIANPQRQHGPVGGQKLFCRSHSEIKAHAGHFGSLGNYNFKRSMQKLSFDQLGLLVDIYA